MPNLPAGWQALRFVECRSREFITTENIVSRASVGLASPVSITAPIVMISMLPTLNVRMSVPYGSPRMVASSSACAPPSAHP
jgi:hypothetical protein